MPEVICQISCQSREDGEIFVGFFFQVSLEQLLKFFVNSLPSLLTSPKDGQSRFRIQKLILLWVCVCVCVFGGGGGSRKFCNTSGAGHKNPTHTARGSLKMYKN